MLDRFERSINYLRVSVTDRCNLRCRYCMPEEGVSPLMHEDVLSFEEIVEVVRAAVRNGIDKVRLTGGEPLVRKGIVELVRMIAGVSGVKDLAMTTNGQLLGQYAGDLKRAGLNRVNVSLDTVDPEKFRFITRTGELNLTLDGIEAARKAGLLPVKLNCVVSESKEEMDAMAVNRFGAERGMSVRFIRQMNLESGSFWSVDGGDGGKCSICNRLRLTSDGRIIPCLFSDISFSVRELGPDQALKLAVEGKPAHGECSTVNRFYSVGG
ncbi:MAG: radical SAM protein [Candidatus Wallbacteria bacterium]|nr:radical SAM protein [Candidatus Wallbacteria bacterium]